MSVTIRLADDLDMSPGRHDLPAHNQPHVGQDIDAMVCWLTERVVAARRAPSYAIKHTTRCGRAVVKDLQYRLDVNTLHRDEAADRRWRSTRSAGSRCARTVPLFFDEYRRNRTTGSFILIDEVDATTRSAPA